MNSTVMEIGKAHANSLGGVVDLVSFQDLIEAASWFKTLGWMTFASTYMIKCDVEKAALEANNAVQSHNNFRKILASGGQGFEEKFTVLDTEYEIVAYNEPYATYVFIPESLHPVEMIRITHNGKR